MVEFGLKLEDNRVAEWSDKYIDYNKLKLLIEKLAKIIEKRKELEGRNQSLAKQVKESFTFNSNELNSVNTSRTSLASMKVDANEDIVDNSITREKTDENLIAFELKHADDETSSLLLSNQLQKSKDGVHTSTTTPPSPLYHKNTLRERSSSFGTFQMALSNVTSYFKSDAFEDKLQRVYSDEEGLKQKFATLLEDQVCLSIYILSLSRSSLKSNINRFVFFSLFHSSRLKR